MQLLGIGTDIVQLSRIEDLYVQFGDKFLARILSPYELNIIQNNDHKISYLAKRFAAKEAVAKALGTGMGKFMAFTEISIENTPEGKPIVVLLGKAKTYADSNGVREIAITLSDEKEYAVAFAIALG